MENLSKQFANITFEDYASYQPDRYFYIVSIDIGVKNLGLSLVSVYKKNYTIDEVVWFDLVNITDFKHTEDWKKEECHMYHDKTFCDYLEHFFYTHHELFKSAKHILIERQPPQGYVVVEQLIFGKYRNKAVLISPNSMHKYLGWNRQKLDYEQRKDASINIFYSYLKKGDRDYLINHFKSFNRKHDISDSFCMILYFVSKMKQTLSETKRKKQLEAQIEYLKKHNKFYKHLCLEQYKFKPKKD